MSDPILSPEDLLAGADATLEVVVPPLILWPVNGVPPNGAPRSQELRVRLRPLSIGAFHLIVKASKDDIGLIPLLMIKESMVEPALKLDQIKRLHLGLVEFLVERVRAISGLTIKKNSTV